MNKQDRDIMDKKRLRDASYVNLISDESLKISQNHAYLLGLKRGQENCAELVKALKSLVNAPLGQGDYIGARAAIAKATGEAA